MSGRRVRWREWQVIAVILVIAAVLLGVVLVVRGGAGAAPRIARPAAGPAGAPGSCEEFVTRDELERFLEARVIQAARVADDPTACRYDLARGRGANLRVAVELGTEREVDELRNTDLAEPSRRVRVTSTPTSLDVASGASALRLSLTDGGGLPAVDGDQRAALLAVADRMIGRLPPFTPGAPVPATAYQPPGPPEPCPETVSVADIEAALGQTVNQVDGMAANCSFWTVRPSDIGVTVAVSGTPSAADVAALRQLDLRRLPTTPGSDGSFYETSTDHGAVHLVRAGLSVVVTVSYPQLPGSTTVPPGARTTLTALTATVLDRL